MVVTNKQYQEALDILHERLPMQLQLKDVANAEWQNLGECYRGREAAFAALNEYKAANPGAKLRVIPKNEADKYREGFLAGSGVVKERFRKPQDQTSDLKGMYFPEHM